MKKVLAFSIALFAFAALAAGFYLYQRQPVSAPSPSAAAADAPPEADLAFALLEEPGALQTVRFIDGSGRAMTLADFNGKVVLLNIWARSEEQTSELQSLMR